MFISKQPWRMMLEACLIAALAAICGLIVNVARSDGLPIVAKEEYRILVPCTEITGEVKTISAGDPIIQDDNTLFVDARQPSEDSKPLPGAISIPYDYLLPTPEESIESLLHARAKAIVVIGDGGNPDSGMELAKELSGKGVQNVHCVEGGVISFLEKTKGEQP